MKIFDVASTKEIERLQAQINDLRKDIRDIRERTYMPHDYGAELYINDAVRAIAEHLNIELKGKYAEYIPRTAVIKPRGETNE